MRTPPAPAHPRRPRALAAVLALGAGCGTSIGPGRGFDIDFVDNRPADVGAVAAQIAARPAPAPDPVVVLTAPPPARGFAAYALPDGRRLFQTRAPIDARPALLGDLVVSHVPGSVVAWDARTGRERWRVGDRDFGLIGAGSDGDGVALALGPGDINRRRGAALVVDARTGAVRFEREVEQALGVPAMAAGYAFFPWNGQYLSMVDVARGDERARIRSTDDIFGRAVREGNAVYFGARALYRLGAEAARGARGAAGAYAPPRQDLPGNPPLMMDGYAIAPAGLNARERVAVVFRPDPAEPGSRPVDGTLYALFHRVVFALDAGGDGAVRWAHVHPADVAGALPVRGGLLLVDERGTAAMLDARAGNVVWRQALGGPCVQAVIQAPLDFAPPRADEEPVQAPATTLIAAAGGTDARLLPARLFAVRALAALPGDEATRGLLDVASRRGYPPPLRAAAGEALARRTDGLDALLEALGTHYDYVRGTQAPPVGFIARALAAARDRRAVGPLVAHLQDPETPATELPPLVAALRELADPTAVPALLDFVRLYHADEGAVPPVSGGDPVNDRSLPEQEAINAALELAVQAVAQLGTPTERRWLEALRADQNTAAPVRLALERALAGAAPDGAASAQGDAAAAAQGDGAEPGAAPGVPPPRLTADMIRDAFAPVREQMLQCLSGAPSRPSQLRVQFRYDAAGTVSTVTVTPPRWQACIAPLAASVRLPPSQVAREIGTYYLIGETP